MANNQTLDTYKLSRQWFDFAFENPDLITPAHTALYFFCVEHCNRLGGTPKFGLPVEMAKNAIGIRNYRTYRRAFDDLVFWGFIRVHEKSKNQYSANIVALVLNAKATTKALSIATQKQSQKQYNSTAHINKPINQEPITSIEPTQIPIIERRFFSIDECLLSTSSEQIWSEQICMLHHITVDQFQFYLSTFAKVLGGDGITQKEINDFKHHFNRWLPCNKSKYQPITTNTPTYGQK